MNETTTPGALAPGVVVPSVAADSGGHAGAGGHDPSDSAESLSPVPLGRRQQAWARLMREYPHRFDIALALVILLATVGALISAHRMGDDPTPPSWVWFVSVIACAARAVPPGLPVAGAGRHRRRIPGGAVVQP